MGFVPPPLQITSEEFHKRWIAGARTLKDIDPALYEWNRRCERMPKLLIVGSIIAIIGSVIVSYFIR